MSLKGDLFFVWFSFLFFKKKWAISVSFWGFLIFSKYDGNHLISCPARSRCCWHFGRAWEFD